MERIDKLFAESDILTRSECKKAVSKRQISVNGITVTSSSLKINNDDEVIYLGKKISFQKYVYIMLNKPQGVVSATEDGRDKTVVDILPEEYKRRDLFPCGRLDKDTVGLVIITNDGISTHRNLAPKSKTPKKYSFTLVDPITKDQIEIIEKGVELRDGYVTSPCIISMDDSINGNIIITEGKYHEIKRMFATQGNKVIFLKRISFGDIVLDPNLKEGECRYLSQEEVNSFVK